MKAACSKDVPRHVVAVTRQARGANSGQDYEQTDHAVDARFQAPETLLPNDRHAVVKPANISLTMPVEMTRPAAAAPGRSGHTLSGSEPSGQEPLHPMSLANR